MFSGKYFFLRIIAQFDDIKINSISNFIWKKTVY